MRRNHLFPYVGIVVLVFCLILTIGCAPDDPPVAPPGTAASDPYPDNSAIDAPVLTVLAWSYPDFDPDQVSFDVYCGTSDPPPMIASQVSDTTYDPGPLGTDEIYYWYIVAHPASGPTGYSEIWSFSTSSSFIYPISIGNYWDYHGIIYPINIEPDTLAIPMATVSGNSRTVILRSGTLRDTLDVYAFHVYWISDEGGYEINRFLNNTMDGLFMYAYVPYHWLAPPKKSLPDGLHIEFKGQQFESMSKLMATVKHQIADAESKLIDSLYYEWHPVRELAYPLEIGRNWVYRSTDMGDSWYMEKEVVGQEQIDVPAGSFSCLVIEWRWDYDNDGDLDPDVIEGYDYMSGAGGIKRVFTLFDLQIVDYVGDTLGTFDIVEQYELTDFGLQ